MARNDQPIANFEKLLQEIREQGVPYDSTEPDPLYWANFRVRVMDRIETNEAKAPAARWRRLQGWLAEHVVGASIATSAAAFVVAMLVMVHPFDVRQEASKPMAEAKPVTTQVATEQQSLAVANMAHPSDKSDKSYATKNQTVHENFADAEALTNTESDDAVSLEELSPSELQSVLHTIQSAE